MKIILTCIAVIAIIVSSCYYENEEHLFPTLSSSCDTANVTFSGSVKSILSQNCLSCHANSVAASFGGNYKLQDYVDVEAHVVDGMLLGAIEQKSGFFPMPPGGKLNNCDIATIVKWINTGSPNN